jgi:ABC-type branched-subunit amino acid transport system ATPase component
MTGPTTGAVPGGAATTGTGNGLLLSGLVVRFGGLVAVDGVNLHAPTGRVTGLIGPNGAGKTTTFNACSGLVRPTAGSVRLFGQDVTAASPPARAQRGLGRTFQRMELFDSLLVRENIALGREAGLAGSRPWHHLRARHADRDAIRAATDDALELCGITDLADRRPADLSTGQRRLVELARVVAGGFRVLLLDEPSSGLDHSETDRFGDVLRHLVDERGTGLLIVEHDMGLVMRVCDYLYVLDFGRAIFDGEPEAVVASDVVRAAYLGDETAEIEEMEAGLV